MKFRKAAAKVCYPYITKFELLVYKLWSMNVFNQCVEQKYASAFHCLQQANLESTNDRPLEPGIPAPSSPSRSSSILSLAERTATEPLEIVTEPPLLPDEPAADFVKCTPSPHTSALSHLRRSSVSMTVPQQSRAVNSIRYEQLDSSASTAKGSAKKVLGVVVQSESCTSPF